MPIPRPLTQACIPLPDPHTKQFHPDLIHILEGRLLRAGVRGFRQEALEVRGLGYEEVCREGEGFVRRGTRVEGRLGLGVWGCWGGGVEGLGGEWRGIG